MNLRNTRTRLFAVKVSAVPAVLAVLAVLIAWTVLASSALAVKPGQWVRNTEAAFGSSSLDQTIVTNLGRIELARASEKIAKLKDNSTIIYDMVSDPNGKTWLAAGPDGELLTLDKHNKIHSVAKYKNAQVFALAVEGDALWVAISGKTSRLEKREGGKVVQTLDIPGVRYIWDVLISDGKLYLATGTDGKVLEIDPAAPGNKPTPGNTPAPKNTSKSKSASAPRTVIKPIVVLDCKQNNVLCLGIDAQKRLYAGTDTEGLVYRITPQPNNLKHPFRAYVMYDAAEPEIGAMIVMPDGTVYAGTADANQAKPGRLNEATKKEKGKPAPTLKSKTSKKPTPHPIPTPPEKPAPPLPPKPVPQPNSAPKTPQNNTTPGQSKSIGGANAATGSQPGSPPTARLSVLMAQTAVSLAEGNVTPANITPTKAQYNKLRQLIGKRLLAARKTGILTVGKNGNGGTSGDRIGPHRAGSVTKAAIHKPGNAVYRISPNGFVREVFRESVMILRMAMVNHQLIIATGNEGQVYRVDPAGQEMTVLADLESKQIPALLVRNGQIFLGTANPAQIVRLNAGFAHTGSFTADPLDATQISHWGQLQIIANLPPHTAITVSTRSGNLANPDDGFWSDWSTPVPMHVSFDGQPFFLEVPSPAARFIQYKLALSSDGSATPSVSQVSLKYLMPNLAPKIASLHAEYPKLQIKPNAVPTPRHVLNVNWQATDPNHDTLRYTLEARRLGTDQPFVTIVSDLKNTNYAWNTLTMPDGRYELRITASDAPDNVPDQTKTAQRLSAPVVIDNTPPTITHLAATVQTRRGQSIGPGPGSAPGPRILLTAKISDVMSIIADIRYSLSSHDRSNDQPVWNIVLPVDQIDDSTNESVSFNIPPFAPGVRVLTLRATDAQGNTRYQSITVTVPKP